MTAIKYFQLSKFSIILQKKIYFIYYKKNYFFKKNNEVALAATMTFLKDSYTIIFKNEE